MINTIKSMEEEKNINCLFCPEIFSFPEKKDVYLAHLYLRHKFVIADVNDIDLLCEYLSHWKDKITEENITDYCTAMLLDHLPDGTPSKNEKYYLLSDILPEDYELRTNLTTKFLDVVLAQHQFERTDRNFKRDCLYCRDALPEPTRACYIQHLYNKHFLQLGKQENLVFIDELIDIVQSKIENFICLYCEKTFKDRKTLKEHMRKKGHKRINPDKKTYDKFFLVNYKKNSHLRKNQFVNKPLENSEQSDVFQIEDGESDWSDWKGNKPVLICLFCETTDIDFQNLQKHMNSLHGFNFEKLSIDLNFYQKIKVVNYIRRKMLNLCCVICQKKCESTTDLQNHLHLEKHIGIGEKCYWDQPEFFFPTNEDDALLFCLEDANDNDLEGIVFSEDTIIEVNKEAESLSLEKINKF